MDEETTLLKAQALGSLAVTKAVIGVMQVPEELLSALCDIPLTKGIEAPPKVIEAYAHITALAHIVRDAQQKIKAVKE